jgi:hypothetical protein
VKRSLFCGADHDCGDRASAARHGVDLEVIEVLPKIAGKLVTDVRAVERKYGPNIGA